MNKLDLDCLLVTPPFSPNTSNPLLGPAVLKAHAEDAGHTFLAVDVNIAYMAQFDPGPTDRAAVVGDHNADERRIDMAREHFAGSIHLPPIPAERIPSCDDPNGSLAHTFAEIDMAIERIMAEGYWPGFFDANVFDRLPQPVVLGISLMGPAQVVLSLVLARMAKARWPETTVVAGGSHITLLAARISGDPRYADAIDAFLPGHSEGVLVEAIGRAGRGEAIDGPGVLRAGRPWLAAPGVPVELRLPPVFEAEELAAYRTDGRITLPIQLARGCSYGRCTYCTYPVVEQFEHVPIEKVAHHYVSAALPYEPTALSVKDSLLTNNSMLLFGGVMAELAPGLPWSATTKVHHTMTPERMREIAAHGCATLEMGIETIHPASQRFFDKVEPLDRIEAALDATLSAGIAVVINMIYGIPGETIDDAHRQWDWWHSWRDRYPGRVFGVHNLLQIDEGSPLAMTPERYGLTLRGSGPWAFTHVWDAPEWRPEWERHILESGGRAQ